MHNLSNDMPSIQHLKEYGIDKTKDNVKDPCASILDSGFVNDNTDIVHE